MDRKIFKTGHSLVITLSAKLLKEIGLKIGDSVQVELDENRGQLVVRPGGKDNQLSLNLRSRPKLGSARRN